MSLSILFCVVRPEKIDYRNSKGYWCCKMEDVLINAFACKPQADALVRNQQSGKLVIKAITDKTQIWKTLNRLGKSF